MKAINRALGSGIRSLTSSRSFISGLFSLCSWTITQDAAAKIYRKEADRILSLACAVDSEDGRRRVKIPRLPGIDENMRSWSICMTLEHLVITNEMMVRVIRRLAREKPFTEIIDFAMDVMPSENPGAEQISALRVSAASYERNAARFGKTRSKIVSRHPVFGMFDVHKWRCMAGFHMFLHRKQVEHILKLLSIENKADSSTGCVE